MIFTTKESSYKELLNAGHPLLKADYANGSFIDAWLGEASHQPPLSRMQAQCSSPSESPSGADPHPSNTDAHPSAPGIHLNWTANGLFGSIEVDVPHDHMIEAITRDAYLQLFHSLKAYPRLTVIRYWNFVPRIIHPLGGATVYQQFNAGRYQAFRTWYGESLDSHPIPAASAVGATGTTFRIVFMAVPHPIASIENKDQTPAYNYSEKFGKTPPFFSRGVIFDNKGQRILLSSGTASVTGEQSQHTDDIYEQTCLSIHNLRILGSQFNLKKYDIHYGFALEDIALLRVYYKREEDKAFLERFIPRFLSPSAEISFRQAAICREELLVEMEALFIKKGESEQGSTPKYKLEAQHIRTESFEIHVAEHCNLKCRDCCNISPFNAKKFITLDEVQDICNFVKEHFRPDVFKIAGGEPTLHPQLDQILKIVKTTCSDAVVRVVSNGLLLHRMTDTFWQNIDQLTISNYISAPVKPRLLEEIKQKARKFEVVLNIKYVEQFNEIFVDHAIDDKARIQDIYNDCWMRHRCLIIRNHRFYKCTRSAYMDNFLHLKDRSAQVAGSSYSQEDGIDLNDPAFQSNVLTYLNDTTPLHSCEYCLGVSGGLRENIQLR